MGIYETFTKRRKRIERAGKQDVYQYEELPEPFRVQVIHIWNSALGRYYRSSGYSSSPTSPANKSWQLIHDTLAREYGVFSLSPGDSNHALKCKDYILRAESPGVLDIIELSFRTIDRLVRKMDTYDYDSAEITQDPDGAIAELNRRFLEHGVGYQYVEGILVRLDSQFAHAEIVKPAISLLNEAGFDGPADEFINAFEHYRRGRNKEAVAEALKAFESTMKAICVDRKWPFPPTATAKPLLDILFKNGIIPSELDSHFTGLRSALESGLPTLSNRNSRHGQGASPTSIPQHFASYALHLAATNIVFLVQAHKSIKSSS
jgi:hypothetical protein